MSKVSIVMGSDSDLPVMADAARILEGLGVEIEVVVSSAHRTPEQTAEYAASAVERGIEVIIAGAGGAAHLGFPSPQSPSTGRATPASLRRVFLASSTLRSDPPSRALLRSSRQEWWPKPRSFLMLAIRPISRAPNRSASPELRGRADPRCVLVR